MNLGKVKEEGGAVPQVLRPGWEQVQLVAAEVLLHWPTGSKGLAPSAGV